MLFIKTDELKVGMRLARPIYNKNGVLLYERNSKLSVQGINSVKNFGIIGIFILEPAEPVPPMTKDDIAFERFQTMEVFAIQEELNNMIKTRKTFKLQTIVAEIIRNYGRMDRKINFIQNLRSSEDAIFKHTLNVAILCALMTHRLNMRLDEQLDTVIAAVVHDVGKLTVDRNVHLDSAAIEQREKTAQVAGHQIIDEVCVSNLAVKRICGQAQRALDDMEQGDEPNAKIMLGARVLMVAETFDNMTAMRIGKEPLSEVAAVKHLMQSADHFDRSVVDSLINSIYILSPGTCVELNTGEKGLVLVANDFNILKPTILGFQSNTIFDLSNKRAFGDIEIQDIMKTMDNRYVMDIDLLKQYGYKSKDVPEFEEINED